MRSLLLLPVCWLILSSCALSPQEIRLQPSVDLAPADFGDQRSINIVVEDRRSSPVIGTRGGVYPDTSTIAIGNDYRSEVAKAVASALRQWNFQPQVNPVGANDLRFIVGIEQISYRPGNNPAVGQMHIAVNLSLVVEKGKQRYQGQYGASGELGYVTASAAKNEARINEIFDLALQKLFSDAGLVAFLH